MDPSHVPSSPPSGPVPPSPPHLGDVGSPGVIPSHFTLSPGKRALGKKLQSIARNVVGKEDVWAKHDMAKIKAERIKRHVYDPHKDEWRQDETIVRIQSKPFDEGAMRQCYRMKKLSQLPSDATNHAYHKIDWNQAPNYVAKSYKTEDGSINTSPEGREACFGDIKLQYEAAHWAGAFNSSNPPKKIHIIRAYAIEFVDRPKSPVMTVERFIEGTDEYGVGYVKHNTNSGFVDKDMSRLTPQLFSAYSFYASKGTRMVVDVQGVGDLYTDPQVHSLDLQFGEADLGLRGFALFFHSFEHSNLAFALGIPNFELSRKEKLAQEKAKAGVNGAVDDADSVPDLPPAPASSSGSPRKKSIAFQADQRKLSRVLQTKDAMELVKKKGKMRKKTEFVGKKGSKKLRSSITELLQEQTLETRLRSASVEDYVKGYINKGVNPPSEPFEYMKKINTSELDSRGIPHEIFMPDSGTKAILGRVHLEIAHLYGTGRFNENDNDLIDLDSAFFHVCMGAMYNNGFALVTLARCMIDLETDDVCAGIEDVLSSNGLSSEFGKEEAVGLLERAAEQGDDEEGSKAAKDAIHILLQYTECEADKKIKFCEILLKIKGGDGEEEEKATFVVGDKVKCAYGGGGSWYDAKIKEVGADGTLRIYYPEDDEEEWLLPKFVKSDDEAEDWGDGDNDAANDDDEEEVGMELFEVYEILGDAYGAKGEDEKSKSMYAKGGQLAAKAGKMEKAMALEAKSRAKSSA